MDGRVDDENNNVQEQPGSGAVAGPGSIANRNAAQTQSANHPFPKKLAVPLGQSKNVKQLLNLAAEGLADAKMKEGLAVDAKDARMIGVVFIIVII